MFEKLGRFKIKGLLGKGAMGEVYLGIDPSLDREVAIKTILTSAAQGENAKERFSREARSAGALNHPNIVTIYEFGEDQGVLYIAMERVKGQDLEEMLRQRSITHGEALEVLAQVCEGLEFAHRNQIIHRDIKPSNVRVLREGRRLQAKIMDFGVARLQDSDMTATGMVMGTVSYMAPEYIRTGRPDGRSDLFAVGVMLYECISGRRPFEGDTTPTILYKIVNEPPDPVDLSHLQEISPSILGVLDRALAKDPDHRYQTAEELAQALRAAKDPTWPRRSSEATAKLHIQSKPAALSKPRRHPVIPRAALMALSLAGLGILGFGGYLLSRKLTGRSEEAVETEQLISNEAKASPPEPPPHVDAPPQTAPPGTMPSLLVSPAPRKAPPGSRNNLNPESHNQSQPPAPIQDPPPLAEPDPGPLTPGRKNVSNISLSEAIALADSKPAQAIMQFRRSIAADPSNAQAYAWLVAVLYDQQRYREIPGVLAKARQNGIGRAQLMNNMRFRMAVQNNRLNNRVPGGMGEAE